MRRVVKAKKETNYVEEVNFGCQSLANSLPGLKRAARSMQKYRIYAFCDPGGRLYLTYNVFENMHGMSTLHMALRKL